ncbi:MAG: MerR family DNA-binding transcriptional regulator [Oscillospiraceae bacterium]|nr:MerR family DNA-binding transcriptional regulator [Oscillospiraceae bacterium]
MSEKEKLLTIGEMSKLTGSGIKALRHYDKIGVLKPAYVEPFTGYRYYSFSQTYIVGLIQFAVELDIPLKSLTQYVDDEGTMDYEAFAAKGNEMVRTKMKTLERAMKFYDFFEENLALEKTHELKQLYSRKIQEKAFFTIPYKQTFSDYDEVNIAKLFLDMAHTVESDYTGDWAEYGFMTEYTAQGIYRHIFIEATENTPPDIDKYALKKIPSGLYHCRQHQESQIEDTAEIFKEYLADKKSYIAIETEIICGKFNINHPINELRVISAD